MTTPGSRPPALGVDIGGVLIARADGPEDTSFFEDGWRESPEVEGAFEALAALREAYGDRVHLVSKAHRRTEWKTREWLQDHELEVRTGVSPWRLWFTQDRAEKDEIARVLGLTAFVDDRVDVLEGMRRVRARVLLDVLAEHVECGHDGLVRVPSWSAAVPLLQASAQEVERGSPR